MSNDATQKLLESKLAYFQTFANGFDEPARYGRIVNPEEARLYVRRIPFVDGVGKWFVESFDKHAETETITGIKHMDVGILEYYLIGKVRVTDVVRHELTVIGGMVDQNPETPDPSPTLQLGLNYNGNDTQFQPTIPQQPKRFLYSLVSNWRKNRERRLLPFRYGDRFPLISREYGAKIYLKGELENPKLELDIKDERLEKLARSLYLTIETFRTGRQN